MSKKLDEFMYVCWKNFDRLLYQEMPNLPVEIRVELANHWDKKVESFEHLYYRIQECYNMKLRSFYKEPDDGFKELWGTELEDMLKKHDTR